VVIEVYGRPYLFDFGPGVVRRAAAAGLAVADLKLAFLTHLHTDHTAGYPDLIFTPWVLERDAPLQVYGPPGLAAMTDHILAAYQQDIEQRLSGLEPANDQGYQVIAQEIEPGYLYQDDRVTIEPFRVQHGSWPAYGYRITAPDRVIVLSGDTVPFAGLAEQYRGCDVLIHEVYSVAGLPKRPPAWQAYHTQVHTSSHQLAEIANQVRPKLLILYHQLFWGTAEADLVAEVRERYDGQVVSGKDLAVY